MPNTYLTVPFREKDTAKALGARWDSDRRQWYVSDGAELAPFQKWLPVEAQRELSASRDLLGDAQQTDVQVAPRGIPLSKLLTGVAAAVAEAFSHGVWTIAEVLRVATSKDGHVYLELSERDSQGRDIAKAQAAIWSRTAQRIIPEFERATGGVLGAGIKLLVKARPVFKAQYGFSLDIDALDPTYTLGDLEAKRREIRQRLTREDLINRNRRLPSPWDFSRILVAAPLRAAGLGDFAKEAERLARHSICSFVYAHSRFQGPGAPVEILSAIRSALDTWVGAPPDAVIIIRGGGAVTDLAWLDDYDLARFICECSYPVLTGIGHERDRCVLDEVAHQKFDTPSKVIAGIEQHIARRAREARENSETIMTTAARLLAEARRSSERVNEEIRSASLATVATARRSAEQSFHDLRLSSVRHVHEARLAVNEAFAEVKAEAKQHVRIAAQETPALLASINAEAASSLRSSHREAQSMLSTTLDRAALDARRAAQGLDSALASLGEHARRNVESARLASGALFREVAGQGPEKTLRRGFAIVRTAEGGHTITRAAKAASGSSIEVSFLDGRVSASVTSIETSPSPDQPEHQSHGSNDI